MDTTEVFLRLTSIARDIQVLIDTHCHMTTSLSLYKKKRSNLRTASMFKSAAYYYIQGGALGGTCSHLLLPLDCSQLTSVILAMIGSDDRFLRWHRSIFSLLQPALL